MECKIIFGLMFVFSTIVSHVQKNKTFIPPDVSHKSSSFMLNELQLIDSVFIEYMDSLLFNKKCHYADLKDFNLWRNFHISFEKQDSLTYLVFIELWNLPLKEAVGFFKRNEYFYFFGGDIPPNIISILKSKKLFSYKDYIPFTVDPPLWILIYDSQSGNMKIKEMYCY